MDIITPVFSNISLGVTGWDLEGGDIEWIISVISWIAFWYSVIGELIEVSWMRFSILNIFSV